MDHGSRTEPNLFSLLALQILPKLNLREKNQIIWKGLSASTCKAASLALGTKYLEYHSGAALFSCWTALSCLWWSPWEPEEELLLPLRGDTGSDLRALRLLPCPYLGMCCKRPRSELSSFVFFCLLSWRASCLWGVVTISS